MDKRIKQNMIDTLVGDARVNGTYVPWESDMEVSHSVVDNIVSNLNSEEHVVTAYIMVILLNATLRNNSNVRVSSYLKDIERQLRNLIIEHGYENQCDTAMVRVTDDLHARVNDFATTETYGNIYDNVRWAF